MSRELGTVEQDAAWAPQPPDRPTPGVDEAVIGPAPCLIQLLAIRQWQPAPGLWIDILRIHGIPHRTPPQPYRRRNLSSSVTRIISIARVCSNLFYVEGKFITKAVYCEP